MIGKMKKYFLEHFNTKKREGENKIPEFTYLQMVELLKNHYRYETIITGQIRERTMNRRLSSMSFDSIKELFDSILEIENESFLLNK